MRGRVLLAFYIVIAFILSCASLQDLAKIQKPTLNLDKVRFTGISFDAINLAFDIKVSNPNPISAKLAGFDYDFFLEGASFLKGKQTTQVNIAGKGESTVEIPLTLDFNDVYNTFKKLGDQDSTVYKLNCGMSFDLPILGPTRIPLSHDGKLPLIKLPKILISGLKLNNLSFTKADLVLNLKVDNPNTFDVISNALSYNFKINGKQWASGKSTSALTINEKSTNTVAIPISLNILEMGRTVYSILSGNQKLNYQFDGDFDFNTSLPMLGQVNLPIQKTGQLNLLK
jgi:LEA14-like dessication related protein